MSGHNTDYSCRPTSPLWMTIEFVLKISTFTLLVSYYQPAFAQKYSLLIRGGHVIDPKNNIDGILDIAIRDSRIVEIAKDIDSGSAVCSINAKNSFVVPGLIDIHTHIFYGPDPARAYCNGTKSIVPDSFTLPCGITTVVDAGSSGWEDFPVFIKKVINKSQTRVLAFLNIVGKGMRGGKFEQDKKDMDPIKAALTAKHYPKYIVGIKLAHYKGADWLPVEKAIEAGKMAKIPVMVDFGENRKPLSLKKLFFDYMRPGDIFTHCFAQLKNRESILDTSTNKIKPFVWEAKRKGVIFGVGYGARSFSFDQAIPAINAGFYPNSISTDLHAATGENVPTDLMDIMSRFLVMGMRIQDIIETVTWNPAKEIHHPELGNLSIGAIADLAILKVYIGEFQFDDDYGRSLPGRERIRCETSIKDGKIVFEKSGMQVSDNH